MTLDVLVSSGHRPHNGPYALTFGSGEAVPLRGLHDLSLAFTHRYAVVRAEAERGPWKVTTRGYIYELLHAQGQRLIAYHWHPDTRKEITWPHLHLPGHTTPLDLRKAHVPTGRVSVEAVLRFAIDELQVQPMRGDWRTVLSETEAAFHKWRTW